MRTEHSHTFLSRIISSAAPHFPETACGIGSRAGRTRMTDYIKSLRPFSLKKEKESNPENSLKFNLNSDKN